MCPLHLHTRVTLQRTPETLDGRSVSSAVLWGHGCPACSLTSLALLFCSFTAAPLFSTQTKTVRATKATFEIVSLREKSCVFVGSVIWKLYWVEISEAKVRRPQHGVVQINCMRNAVESGIQRYILLVNYILLISYATYKSSHLYTFF